MKMVYGKKGQSEMMETFMVIVVIIILLVVGLFIYYSFFLESIGKRGEQVAEESTIALLSAATSLPEINCYGKSACVDMAKVMAFKKILETHKKEYEHFFGGRSLRIRIVYPKPQVKKECSYSDYQQTNFPANCDTIVIHKGINKTNQINIFGFPTAVYLPPKNRYVLGRVEVVYTK